MARELVEWKQATGTEFLKDVHSQVLQQTLMNLDRAMKDAFNKKSPKRFPVFKKKGQHDSFCYPQGFRVDQINSRVFLPKIGWVSYRKSRELTGKPKNITVSRRGDKWDVSIQTEQEVTDPVHPVPGSSVGIDRGVAVFAAISNGSNIEPVSAFKENQSRLARLQRRLAGKTKFSMNWRKEKQKITRLHERIGNIRRDFLHKASTTISKNHAVVVIEDLAVANMSRSAKGTKEYPGRNVRAKSGLNRSILDQGWGEFGRQLEYKLLWLGGKLVKVPPAYTSQTCSKCDHVAKESRKSQAVFTCVSCGYVDNADTNAAKNILAAGHAATACGGMVHSGHPMKQEPSEATIHELACA